MRIGIPESRLGEKRKEKDSLAMQQPPDQRLKDMDRFLKQQSYQMPEFDNDLVRRLIANIKVVSSDKLLIQFQSGIVMEQEIRYD